MTENKISFLQQVQLYARLIRWPNLLLLALGQVFVRYGILGPILNNAYIDLSISLQDFIIFVVSTMLISAGGYVINDYFDIQIDEVNKPGKVILQKKIPLRTAVGLHYGLSIAGCLLGFYIAWEIGNLMLGFINVVVAMFLYFYSLKYKRMPFVGNITIALLTALSIIVVWLFEFFSLKKDLTVFSELIIKFTYRPINLFVLGFATFAFLVNLIREMVKDMEDIEGDRAFQCRTLPVILGIKKMKLVILLLSVATVLVTAFASYKLFGWDMAVTAWYFAVVLGSLWFYFLIALVRAKEKKDFHNLSLTLKVIILAGVLSMQLLFLKF